MKQILLVDDDPVILTIYRKKLLEAGFQVDTAADGLAAMKQLHSAPPDLMVLDVMMPKFSGLEVLKYVRSERALKDVRVFILSNMFFGGEQLQAATTEADKAFAKSNCTPAILLAAIHEILATPKDQSAPEAPNRPATDIERRVPLDPGR
jgi:DNA-binding response OmpR family regulator